MATRNFVDLSSNNGPNALDAAAYAAAGHVLVAIKATEGTDYINPDWAAQTHDAHNSHVSVLSYHFARPGSGKAQADFMLNFLRKSGEFHEYDAIALDLERGGGVQNPTRFMAEFDEACLQRGHENLVVYTEQSYHEEWGLAPKNGRLWIADYSGFLDGFWADQYTDAGRVRGVREPVDVSRLSIRAWMYHRLHRP
jgi:lysozyme